MGAFLAKAAMGALMGLATKLISRELFEGIAQDCIVKLLTWESTRTTNTLDDALAARVIEALEGKP